jgi:hypothetical protein
VEGDLASFEEDLGAQEAGGLGSIFQNGGLPPFPQTRRAGTTANVDAEMAACTHFLTLTADFIRWFLPKIEKFPRNYKFLFGDRLVSIQLDLLEKRVRQPDR